MIDSSERLRTEVALPVAGAEHYFAMTLTPVTEEAEVTGLLVASVDITEQKRQQERQALIARELAHRAKNVLALVEGIARQSVKAENLPEAVAVRFTNRLAALGRAHDLLVNADWQGIDLGALVRAQLHPLLPEGRERVTIEGPDGVIVSPEIGQYLALGLHELATNAFKYGVLSRPEGQLALRWGDAKQGPDGREIVIEWTETGAPIAPPERRGFGRMLLESILPRALQGAARLEFGDDGLLWRIAFNGEVAQRAVG